MWYRRLFNRIADTFFFASTARILRTYMLNHFYLSRNELKLLRFIFADAVQRASAAITDFIFIKDIVDDDFTRQVFRQWFTLRFIARIADGFQFWRFNIGSQFFRLIKQFTLTRVATTFFSMSPGRLVNSRYQYS